MAARRYRFGASPRSVRSLTRLACTFSCRFSATPTETLAALLPSRHSGSQRRSRLERGQLPSSSGKRNLCASAVAVRGESREELVLRIGPAERLALEQLSGADPDRRDAATIAESVLRDGLIARLTTAGLPSPYGNARATPSARGERGPRQTRWNRVCNRRETRAAFIVGAAVGLAVVLVGGYRYRWSWTGFADNNQLWDWLNLLILPVAFGTFAVWLRHGRSMGRPRRLALATAAVAFAAFVAAGYLVPLTWTGFKGNTVWDWLTLLLLPLALTTVKLWPSTAREISAWHVAFSVVLALALLITLIGGYAGGWTWTGYPGNTLWDWLSLVLGPVVIATLVIPAVIRWMSGDVERLTKETETPKRLQ